MSCVRSQNLNSDVLPTWAGMRCLYSKGSLPLFQVGYLQCDRVFSSLYCNAKLCLEGQLDKAILPVFCDKSVFRIALDIFLTCPDEFRIWLYCLEHGIGKFARGYGLEDGLLEIIIPGEKLLDSVL